MMVRDDDALKRVLKVHARAHVHEAFIPHHLIPVLRVASGSFSRQGSTNPKRWPLFTLPEGTGIVAPLIANGILY